jgi:hypothetical protein
VSASFQVVVSGSPDVSELMCLPVWQLICLAVWSVVSGSPDVSNSCLS